MNSMHEWLRQTSGFTADKSWEELSRLRRLGVAWEDLPADRVTCEDELRLLALGGLAERSGDLWLWLPAKVKTSKEGGQAKLF